MVTELARDPQGYFAERVKYPQVRRQVVIVAIAGLIANLWQPALLYGLGATSDYIADVLLILAFVGVLEFIAVWLLLTGVMYFVTGLLGGDTNFGRLLRVTGYGYIPIWISGAIWSVGHYLVLTDVGPPEPPVSGGFYYRYDVYTDFIAQGSGDLILLGSILIGSAFVLASGYLWFQAISAETELDTNKALVPAAIALSLTYVWIFISFV